VLEEEEIGFNREGGEKKKKKTCSEGGVMSERERKNRGLRSLMWRPLGEVCNKY
jgi:hypothetical protein